MIFDLLEQWPTYAGISSRFRQGFEFLRQVSDRTPEGRNEIDGDDVFAIAVKTTTTPLAGREFEVHRKYIDVHYIHTGREAMAWAPLSSLSKVTMAFDPEQDAALFAPVASRQVFTVQRGQFAIFFPADGHIPSCVVDAPEPVFKVVLKVRV